MSRDVLAPWLSAQLRALLAQRGHAWLLHGPSGLGQYTLALELARAWLCERPTQEGACGKCGSCHAIDVRTQADLSVLMPETEMLERHWPLSEKAQSELDDKKRKPSKEIRIEAMRDAVDFSQRTSSGGRGKVVLVFPADRMNNVTANALLKTLEEPAGDVRFVLATEMAHQLLPTIRSRCLGHAMAWPEPAQALEWLCLHDMKQTDAQAFLRASGGRPEDALQMARGGRDPRAWAQLPKALQRGDASMIQAWSAREILDAFHKLCHDLHLKSMGVPPRYFEPQDLPARVDLARVSAWGRELAAARRTAEHPFNPGLMQEALVSRAKNVLNSDIDLNRP
jgi:DNA polymerase-3 subunit delta'